MVRFDPLSQAMERLRGAKPDCRVIRREIHAEFFDVHACQFRLTFLMCQPKLTGVDRRVAGAVTLDEKAASVPP